jgi:glycosyltransferase involved in cell wall biosynthesis
MKLSVALCTYQGERFLGEQLDSILRQRRLPDELVVCDDGSTDDSAGIVGRFTARAPFPLRLIVNANRLGSTRNFDQAIRLCSGDVIVLADQDDVWLPHKLTRIESAFRANPEAGFAFSDAEVVDAGLERLGYTLWEAIEFGARERRRFQTGNAFELLLRRYRVTGATMAFRCDFRELILPLPPEWIHDAWIALVISAVAHCIVVEEPMVYYRQHSRQQLGISKRGIVAQYRSARMSSRSTFASKADRYALALERLGGDPGVCPRKLELLAARIEHLRLRAQMREPRRWRLPVILGELVRGNYHRFSRGWKAAAQDLFLQ